MPLGPRESASASSPGWSALACLRLLGAVRPGGPGGRIRPAETGLPALSAAAEVGLAWASRESLGTGPPVSGRGGRPLARRSFSASARTRAINSAESLAMALPMASPLALLAFLVESRLAALRRESALARESVRALSAL